MEMYIARQPILDGNKRLQAYELLYRGAAHYALGQISGERATTSLLTTAFLTEGIEKISSSKPCFINFTEELLLKKVPLSFPNNLVVIEVLEDVPPSPAIIAVCKEFVEKGYVLALDDFIHHRNLEPLINLAKIIKIDFSLTKGTDLERVRYKLANRDVKLLAEKVETLQEFEQAMKLGFTFFQGYFFGKPQMIQSKEIPASKINLLQLLAEVNRKSTTIKTLKEIFSRDVGMTYKLLRYINSAYYYLQKKIESVAHAIVYIGEQGVKRFVILLLVSEIATDKPVELLKLSVVRARFCELLAGESRVWPDSSEVFLLGLFSMIDGLLDTPMKEVMEKLPIDEAIKDALMKKTGPLVPFLTATDAYERNEMEKCLKAFTALGVEPKNVPDYYLTAVAFADSLTRIQAG
ncbi:MAG: HDOD domain-containing protein [Proteobacteria bacterium]|nr:HDOD domain-containing protein [Pseudomonadota bacterium]MBU1739112.1 HDOD domain-containing protein [Pseudomonadota bacterium]